MKTIKTRKLAVGVNITVLLLSSYAFAAPSITSVTGAVTHGQVVTVNGSGFGVKSPVAPLMWDPIDGVYSSIANGATVPTGTGYPWNSSGGSDMYNPTFITTNPRGKLVAKYTNAKSPSSVHNAVLGGKSWSQCTGNKLYLSYWHYPYQDISNPGYSNKIMRLTDNGGWSSSVSTVLWDTGTGALFTYSASSGYTGYDYPDWGNVKAWNRLEVVVDNSVSTRPAVKAYTNNALTGSFQSSSSIANIIGIYTLGADWSNSQNSPIPQLDWGEIYVDNTLARVEICNASAKASSNHCEIQIPQTVWNDGQLQFKVNQGSFPDNSTAYLFVLDASGSVSAGKQITFGSGDGGGTATIAPPSGLKVVN
ncbi:hypothetical protein [Geobacter sulfurreducens]|uniref:hypothetical protein n=1 Tax=Geobacter sulfurreducens TaxID=35554 RepID=UPI0020B67106|nr:hypothetical protein [Geobacter sulfurreducens]UTG91408.1 hypothetical protein J8622_10220 [Geobacter sulfurreducens]